MHGLAWRQTEQGKRSQKNQNLLRYGITLEDYEEILAYQCRVCAICEQTCRTGQMLSVDHCHKTGKVRGLLCKRCNTVIGTMEDSSEFLRRAADYLDDSKSI